MFGMRSAFYLYEECYATYIVLIPKKLDVKSIGDFRPISLMDSVCKVISNVLSIRLHTVMDWVVSNSRGDFCQCKQLLDGIFIANECVDSRMKSNSGDDLQNDLEKSV